MTLVRWRTWDDEHLETLTLQWENEAWTANGDVGRERVRYVMRLSPSWQLRQFLLFRDLDEPDLWLVTDGHARWGEMNGAHRPELDGCVDIDLTCSAFPTTVPIRRLPLDVGDTAEFPVVTVDVETLDVVVARRRYTRLTERGWARWLSETEETAHVVVDDEGLVLDDDGRFRRL